MERSIKYLYYRGVRYAQSFINENKNKLQELSYRGVKMIRNASENVVKSSQPHIYRGVAY